MVKTPLAAVKCSFKATRASPFDRTHTHSHTPHTHSPTHTTLTSVHYANNKQRFLQIKAKQTRAMRWRGSRGQGKQPKNILRIRHVVAAAAAAATRTRFHSKIDLCVAFKRKDKQNQEICCNIYQMRDAFHSIFTQLWHHYSRKQGMDSGGKREQGAYKGCKHCILVSLKCDHSAVVVKWGECGAAATICIIHIQV